MSGNDCCRRGWPVSIYEPKWIGHFQVVSPVRLANKRSAETVGISGYPLPCADEHLTGCDSEPGWCEFPPVGVAEVLVADHDSPRAVRLVVDVRAVDGDAFVGVVVGVQERIPQAQVPEHALW